MKKIIRILLDIIYTILLLDSLILITYFMLRIFFPRDDLTSLSLVLLWASFFGVMIGYDISKTNEKESK